ncbi:MAG: DinB family protein [Terriglobales bacterium]|jgi:uncharacterized damage-inducible protein DinB
MPNFTLRELIYGKGAHVSPVACLEDVPANLANQMLPNYPHNIWQIVEHMNYWMEYELRRIACDPPAYPEHAIESWPQAAPLTGEEWSATTKRFYALLDRLARLAASDSETLSQPVQPDKNKAEAARPPTVEDIVTQISAHNSYHVGQIALLRRQLNAWPPKSGGDTW